MQLTGKRNIANALAMGSCSLLGLQTQATTANNSSDEWQVDTAIMYYDEQDRVQALEAIGMIRKAFGDTSLLDMKLVVDSLTGASASGAVAQDESQTFTQPSGYRQYNVPAGDVPLDDTFQDTRVQASANWREILTHQWAINGGLYGSKEVDYTSTGFNGGLEHRFNKDNTTLALSGSYSYDLVELEDGRPVPLSAMVFRDNFDNEADFEAALDLTRIHDAASKETIELIVGLTQVLNKRWLFQANYGVSSKSGYLTDPYKILSLVDSSGTAKRYIYEYRPDSRLEHSLYLMTKGALDSGVVDFSYRFNTDDWDIQSHTLETHYRYYFMSNTYVQLHLRFYQQQGANFYAPFLLDGQALPEYASADYRIGNMTTYTLGLKFGHRVFGSHEMSYRLEYYQQNPKNNGTELIGQLQHLDLFPKIKAVVAQISYSF